MRWWGVNNWSRNRFLRACFIVPAAYLIAACTANGNDDEPSSNVHAQATSAPSGEASSSAGSVRTSTQPAAAPGASTSGRV